MAGDGQMRAGGGSHKSRQQAHNTLTGKYRKYRDNKVRERNKRRCAEKLERKYEKNRKRRERKIKRDKE